MKIDKKNFSVRKSVFWPSFFIFFSFVLIFFIEPNSILYNLKTLQSLTIGSFGKIYQMGVFLISVVSCYLYFSPLRNTRIGGEDAKPILTRYEWFYITLCTVTAAAIFFWSCSEPLYHIHNESLNLSDKFSYPDTQVIVLALMLLHWSFVPYCIYLIPSLVLALSLKKFDSPISFGSSLTLFFQKSSSKRFNNTLDSICLITLITGMSASLAVGIFLISGALNSIFGIQESPLVYAFVCFVIVISFISSATSGLMRGIRVISFFNTKIFYLIGLFLLILGPTNFILSKGFLSLGFYFKNFFKLTLFSHEFFPASWIKNWTLLHWGSWLAWAPMTGVFLSRLAYG